MEDASPYKHVNVIGVEVINSATKLHLMNGYIAVNSIEFTDCTRSSEV